jgi:Holliday junction resolvase RusA-like endonuclease
VIPLISFFVPGEPRAKQSFRVAGRGRGFTPARVKAWQSDVGWAAQLRMRAMGMVDPIGGNLTVRITFFLKTARKVDLDNLAKCVQDGLNGIVWYDDQQNVRLVLDKYICRAKQGVYVEVAPNDRPLEIDAEIVDVLGANVSTVAGKVTCLSMK